MFLGGEFYPLEQGHFHLLAVDDKIAVEYFMAAML